MMAICYQKAIFSVQTDHIFGESHPRKIEVPIPQKDHANVIGKFGVDEGYLVTREQKRLDFFKTHP